MNANNRRCTGRPVMCVCLEVRGGAHDSILINAISFYFIFNIFPRGRKGNNTHPAPIFQH